MARYDDSLRREIYNSHAVLISMSTLSPTQFSINAAKIELCMQLLLNRIELLPIIFFLIEELIS